MSVYSISSNCGSYVTTDPKLLTIQEEILKTGFAIVICNQSNPPERGFPDTLSPLKKGDQVKVFSIVCYLGTFELGCKERISFIDHKYFDFKPKEDSDERNLSND